MNVYLPAQRSILRWNNLSANGIQYLIVLLLINETITKAAFSVFRIRITYAKREVVIAFIVFGKDIKIALRSAAISFFLLIFSRTRSESYAICSD